MAGKKIIKSATSESLNDSRREALKLTAHPEIADGLETPQFAQQKALFSVIAKIRESLDLDSIFKSTAIEVRQLLKADRVGMYRFNETSTFSCGEFVSEDVLPEFASTLAAQINDHCFGENHAKYYQQGRIWACADIYQHNLPDCHIQILERFQVRANLVVPLLNGDRLWGLLCIHQCSSPRQWLDSEIDFVKQIAMHLDVALQHSEFGAQLRSQAELFGQVQKRSTDLQTTLETQLQKRANELARDAEQERALAEVIDKIRRTLDIDTIFQTATTEVRKLLNSDRVGVFKFDHQDYTHGTFVSEDVLPPYSPALQSRIKDRCFGTDYIADYQIGHFKAIADIYEEGLSDCHIKILERFQVRSNLVIPLYKGSEIWGLLFIHQCSKPRQWQSKEIEFVSKIAIQLGVALQQAELFSQSQNQTIALQKALAKVQAQTTQQAKAAEQERALARVIERIRQTLDIDAIFLATTQEVRQHLKCDRVVVYRFFEDWSGEFVFEAKTDDWLPLDQLFNCDNIWEDTYLQENQGGRYRKHKSLAINDIYKANLTDCHVEILENYQIKAYMVVPVFVGDKLWGLLAAYQNSRSRNWEPSELSLLAQVGSQLGVAVQQVELLVQLKKTKDNADAANRAKGDFLAHMSHELRTPLNSILGFTQVLARDQLLNNTQKEHLGIIARSGEHLLTLLNDVLEMSKIEAGLIELNTNSFDLYNLLNSLKEMFLLKANSKNLQLVFEFAANVPQYVQTDESKLRQVLINLVGNAVKFTDKGKVTLQVAKQENDEAISSDDQEGTDSVL